MPPIQTLKRESQSPNVIYGWYSPFNDDCSSPNPESIERNSYAELLDFSTYSVTTSNYSNTLEKRYNSFHLDNSMKRNQDEILKSLCLALDEIIAQLGNYDLYDEFSISGAEDDEVIIYRKSKNGILNIVIDDEGDIMLSYSDYNSLEKGWRKFIDSDKFNFINASMITLSH